MRTVLALCMLIGLCAAADAAARKNPAPPRQGTVPPGAAATPSDVTPSGARIYRDNSVPGGVRTDRDRPPAYNDPSKFGGG